MSRQHELSRELLHLLLQFVDLPTELLLTTFLEIHQLGAASSLDLHPQLESLVEELDDSVHVLCLHAAGGEGGSPEPHSGGVESGLVPGDRVLVTGDSHTLQDQFALLTSL